VIMASIFLSGLGWVGLGCSAGLFRGLGWVGLDHRKWTHVHVCVVVLLPSTLAATAIATSYTFESI